jgi:HEAT repeat protein
MATNEAYAVLERALVGRSRDAVLEQLIALREDKAIPLLCYVLKRTEPRGKLLNVHLAIIDALGGLSAHPESTATLKNILYRGEWWAPGRTARFRTTAARALRSMGTSSSDFALQEAATSGPGRVRKVAKAALAEPAPVRRPAKQTSQTEAPHEGGGPAEAPHEGGAPAETPHEGGAAR